MKASHRHRPSLALLFLPLLLAACGSDDLSGAPTPPRAGSVAALPSGAAGAYRAAPTPGGLRLSNATQGLRAELTERGVTVAPASGPPWAFEAAATRFGCEGELRALGPAAAQATGNRVEYARGPLREWYVNGPRGLEQGFTLPEPPWCTRGAGRTRRDRVVIELGGGLDAVVSADGQEAGLHDASGREVLRYTELSVIDAAGRRLPAELASRPGGLSIRLDDAGAVYPVVVDPLMWAQRQVLLPADGMPGNTGFFGGAVALRGGTALIGAPSHDPFLEGAAYVFVSSGGIWGQQQLLVAADPMSGDAFGSSVSVSGDTALIGAPNRKGSQGAAYAFVRAGSGWSQQQELTPWDNSQDSLVGASVAVDGDTAVIGSPNNQGFEPGAVFVLTRSGGVWTQQQQLAADDAGLGDLPGSSVAVSGDTVVVGAPGHSQGQGAAYVFVQSGGGWTQQQQFLADDGVPGDRFGISVAVEGDTAVVGAPDRASGQLGAVYVFVRSGGVWTQQASLTPNLPPFAFGNTVALSGDTVVAGWIEGVPTPGMAYVYTRSGVVWTQQQELIPEDSLAGDMFGLSVAVDGPIALIGAANKAAYVFGVGSGNGDACTSSAACASGFCADGVCCTVFACPAPSDCQTATFCQAGTGVCQGTPKPDDLACDDHDACTGPDACKGGFCVGHAPKTCAPEDDCHDFGVCDPVAGTCSTPAKADGQACSSGVCKDGVCGGEASASSSSGAGPVISAKSGCSYEAGGAPPGGALGLGIGLLLLLTRRRR